MGSNRRLQRRGVLDQIQAPRARFDVHELLHLLVSVRQLLGTTRALKLEWLQHLNGVAGLQVQHGLSVCGDMVVSCGREVCETALLIQLNLNYLNLPHT